MNIRLHTYLKSLSPWRREQILLATIERLIELEEVRFLDEDEEDDGVPLYWISCGDPLWENE